MPRRFWHQASTALCHQGRRVWLALLAAILVVAVAPTAKAAITIYTNESDFVSAIGLLPNFVNDFSNDVYYGWLVHSVKANSNGISYAIISSPPLYLYGFPGVFSTVDTNDQIVVDFTSGNVTGAGGYFYSADTNAVPTDGSVTITLSDGTSTNVPSAVGEVASFTGFLSDGPVMTSLSVSNSSGTGFPAMAHFYAVDGIPGLSLTVTSTNMLLLSWFCQPTGFVVQASSQPFGGGWTNLSLTPQLVETQFQTLIPLTGQAGFFRLKK